MRAALITCVVVLAVACSHAAERPASAPSTTRTIEKQDLPGFGVRLPPAPPGFTPVPELRAALIAGEVASWRADQTGERINLWWRPLVHGFDSRDGIDDYFRDAAMGPILLGDDDDGDPTPEDAKPTETKVPHWASWPTVRFEWKASKPVGIRRTEAIAANNLVYVMVHWAPKGESEEGKAAFDAIAAELEFAAPATLGKAIGPGTRRVEVAGDATIRLPEPFRMTQPKHWRADAFDLTFATHRREEEGDENLHAGHFGTDLYFESSGRGLPDAWADQHLGPRLRRLPKRWLLDEADIRIAEPLYWQDKVALVGGRRLEGQRWLWLAWLVPNRIAEDAGGAAKLTAVLEVTLRSAQPVAVAAD